MVRPSVDESSVDIFDVVSPPMDRFGAVDYEVLMHNLEEEERGQREEMVDGMFLTDFIFQRHFQFLKTGFKNLL